MKKGAEHTDQLNRLNRIEGQIRGIANMIADQRYCLDILTQIRAVKSALSSLESKILEAHLNHCVHKALDQKNRNETDKIINEIKDLFKKSSR